MKRSLTENDVDVIEENFPESAEKKSLLRTAIQLKEAISAISKEFKPLGEIVNAANVWRRENDDDYYEDEEDEEDENDENDEEDEGDRNNEGEDEEKEKKVKKEVSFDTWMYNMKNMDDKKFEPFHHGGNTKRIDNVFNTR